jgi:hypothetical protein
VLDYLCDPDQDEPGRQAGYDALGHLQQMEEHAWEVHDTSNLDGWTRVDGLRLLWRNFHVALPYSEAEREWLIENLSLDPQRSAGGLEDQLGYTAEIVSAGLRTTIVAHELISRWMAWRSESEQFRGQGTLDSARSSLSHVITNVAPDAPLPPSFLELGDSE